MRVVKTRVRLRAEPRLLLVSDGCLLDDIPMRRGTKNIRWPDFSRKCAFDHSLLAPPARKVCWRRVEVLYDSAFTQKSWTSHAVIEVHIPNAE